MVHYGTVVVVSNDIVFAAFMCVICVYEFFLGKPIIHNMCRIYYVNFHIKFFVSLIFKMLLNMHEQFLAPEVV